jgi:Predicted phosphoribosyltransferases
MVEKLHVSWAQYHQLIEKLALIIHDSDWRFDQIICIARGGMRIGDVLSRIYDVPLAILAAQSYRADGGTVQSDLIIAEYLSMTTPHLGAHALIVDDMVDSGVTLKKIVEVMPQRYPHIQTIRTAVLWWKACSVIKPDYWVEYLPDNPWICQPFEQYDTLNIEDLHTRNRQ